jgi:glycosyltransferase involved in cell wall biosynthesis
MNKEFNRFKSPSLAAVMMVKNEHTRIHVTLNSLVSPTKTVNGLIVYDTGSTDNTLQIIQEFCEKHKLNLNIITGEFVNFSISRNVLLDHADTLPYDYLLLLDCNDELRNGQMLRQLIKDYQHKENNAFMLCQQWWSGVYDKYYNIRLIKNKSGWRYKGSVHEWLQDTNSPTETPIYPVIRVTDEVCLYQDRTNDDDKSKKRFSRDKVLLLEDYKNNPQDTRTVFYLAQTCCCLEQFEEALQYSSIRAGMEGFQEEKLLSMIRCGDCALILHRPWQESMIWYLKAYEHSERAEPLVKIADYYRHINNWRMAFLFIKEACRLKYPEEALLFVDKGMYDYFRWHLMGIIAYYVGEFETGQVACQKAIDCKNVHYEQDVKNMQFYLSRIKNAPQMDEHSFIEKKIEELKKANPGMSKTKLKLKAKLEWKKSNS